MISVGYCYEDRDSRALLAKKMINYLVANGISMARIAARSGLAKSSIYKIHRLNRAPNNHTSQCITEYYYKMLNKVNPQGDNSSSQC